MSQANLHPLVQKNEIYVKTDKPLKIYYKRSLKLIKEGNEEIYIRGLGKACYLAAKLACKLEQQAKFMDIATSTVTIDENGKQRQVSSVNFKLTFK